MATSVLQQSHSDGTSLMEHLQTAPHMCHLSCLLLYQTQEHLLSQEFKHPSGFPYLGVAVGQDGLLYCSDVSGQVTILNRQGQVIRSFKVKSGGSLYGIALSRTGNVIVSNISNDLPTLPQIYVPPC